MNGTEQGRVGEAEKKRPENKDQKRMKTKGKEQGQGKSRM